MKIRFYPDDITEDELYDMTCKWVSDNVPGFFKKVDKYGREIFEDDE